VRALHLDAFSGIAGNMLLGALLDAGLSRRALQASLAPLKLDYRLVVRKVKRGALAARYVDVQVPKRSAQKKGRHFREIRRQIRSADLESETRDRALSVFQALAEAEAAVHGVSVDSVHFHEVGAIDALVDIVGAASAMGLLGIERITCSPLAMGHGHVDTAHGRLPVPAPATLELLRGVPITPAHVEWETVTPTGAALARVLADEFCPLPALTVETIGLGAGNEAPGPLPNVLRVVIGSTGIWGRDRVAVLETHIDDMNPEHFDYAMERLLEAGALDVGLMHLQMKKNRPGFALRVIAPRSQTHQLAALLFTETSTTGVRIAEMERLVLPRDSMRVDTPYGKIRVKWARAPERVRVAAEYEDCKRAARRAGVSVREVARAAEAAASATLR